MKKKFSKHWKASKKPRKQRKYLANAPLHIRHKFLSANLNKKLRKKYGRRSFPLRKGDEVKIMRGEFAGKTGKIENIDLKRSRVTVEKIQRKKKEGTKINVYFNSSNLQIQELNLEDKARVSSLKKEEKKSKTKKVKQKKKTKKKRKKKKPKKKKKKGKKKKGKGGKKNVSKKK